MRLQELKDILVEYETELLSSMGDDTIPQEHLRLIHNNIEDVSAEISQLEGTTNEID